MPLVRSWWLGKKKGKEAYVVPTVVGDASHPSGLRVKFEIGHDTAHAPTAETDGTVGRRGAVCVAVTAVWSCAEGPHQGAAAVSGAAAAAHGHRRRKAVAQRIRTWRRPSTRRQRRICAAGCMCPIRPVGFDPSGLSDAGRYGLTALLRPLHGSAVDGFDDVLGPGRTRRAERVLGRCAGCRPRRLSRAARPVSKPGECGWMRGAQEPRRTPMRWLTYLGMAGQPNRLITANALCTWSSARRNQASATLVRASAIPWPGTSPRRPLLRSPVGTWTRSRSAAS